MFGHRKIKWYSPSLKSMILSGIFMLVAKMFLRGIDKQASWGMPKVSKKKRGKTTYSGLTEFLTK